MDRDILSDEQIRDILSLKKVAVVGMSRDPSKAAHFVPSYLSDNGYDIIPVNPMAQEILGKRCHRDISEADDDIDIVNVFRPSDQVLPVVLEAIKKRPKVIWLQEGIHNQEAEEIAKKSGIKIIFNRCMMTEHRRLS